MPHDFKKIREIGSEYRHKRELYRDFSQKMADIIRQVLLNAGIKTYSISSREKDPTKLIEKIIRKSTEGKIYKKLTEVEDLAGVRVVAYLESQREEVVNLIYKEFGGTTIEVDRKYNPKGYRGTHFTLSLGKGRTKLSEYSRYKGLKCEIQVASILYHAWSEIEHDVIYKPGDDREKLESLGLNDIEESFQKIMAEHLEGATIQFDLLYKKHKEVLLAGKIIYSDFISDIKSAKSNDYIASILDIAEKFSHKKPEESMQIIEEVIKHPPIPPQPIHKFEDGEIFGKSSENLLRKCIEILSQFQIRYWNTERVLASLIPLSEHASKDISEKSKEAIKNVVGYDHTYISRHKTLYPQETAFAFIKKMTTEDRKKYMTGVTIIAREILSSLVEGTEWISPDKLAFRSGALIPNEGLKKLRQSTIDLIVEMYSDSSITKDKLAMMKVLLTTLHPPHHVAYGDDLIEMIKGDTKMLTAILTKLVFPNERIDNYLIAQEVEVELIQVLRSERFKSDEVKVLYDKLQEDSEYQIFCTLVGDIHEYRSLDENWQEAEQRRIKEVDDLVTQVSEQSIEEWYAKLNKFATPLKEGAIEDWKYGSFRLFIARLTASKTSIATKLLTKAAKDKYDGLYNETFVMPYLGALRTKNDTKSWDNFVAIIIKKKSDALISSLVRSLNVDMGSDLNSFIRDKDITMLSKIVRSQAPFNFAKSDNFNTRYALINTLTRVYGRNPKIVEKLIIEEITNHPKHLNVYFRELPFSSHRKWMSLKDWGPLGITFFKKQLIEIPDLDWHVQEMMLQLGEDPIELILEVFKERIKKKKKRGEPRYEEVPYHFNPDLQRYITKHPKYIEEMVKWLKDMTPKWSTYNWNLTHFIQRIGGASYATIMMRLIENGDKESLKRATYALNDFEGANFDMCLEIVKRTDDKEIIGRVSAAMGATGVVSGENGLAHAFEAKAKSLEPHTTSKDKRINKFATQMKKSFEKQAQGEYERSAKEKHSRKIEFGGA